LHEYSNRNVKLAFVASHSCADVMTKQSKLIGLYYCPI